MKANKLSAAALALLGEPVTGTDALWFQDRPEHPTGLRNTKPETRSACSGSSDGAFFGAMTAIEGKIEVARGRGWIAGRVAGPDGGLGEGALQENDGPTTLCTLVERDEEYLYLRWPHRRAAVSNWRPIAKVLT